MPTAAPRLPNPSSANDLDWSSFTRYLRHHGIRHVSGPVLDAYQMSNSGPYLSASQLNHCLALRHFGTTGRYADLARDLYGDCEDDWEPQTSLAELDILFSTSSYRFTNDSVVFKGIGQEPFYAVLNLAGRSVGEVITFPGFLSTSVCREKAESFAMGNPRVLLQITGLDRVNVVVPLNKCIPNSPTPSIPEQEILLNRGQSFTVVRRERLPNGMVVLHLQPREA